MQDRGFRAKFRYRSDEFLAGGAGRQLGFLFALTLFLALVFVVVSYVMFLDAPGEGFLDRMWWYFTRFLDAGTMGGDEGQLNRFVSAGATIIGVIVAGLLISSLAGNFQERLEAIKRGGSPVMEAGHFLVLGWSEKIYSVLDQISEGFLGEGKRITCVVMAERDKIEMEEKLRDKCTHLDRMKIVVRSGSSVSLGDLTRVSFSHARAIVVLVDENDTPTPNRADGRIIKTLMAIYNHPHVRGRNPAFRVTAEVMLADNQDIARIASGGRAQVIKTNEIISKIILQTARISGLSLVYDELLRFEGNEIHFKKIPPVVGRRFGDILLDFPNGCLAGVAKSDGSGHQLNPSADHVIAPDEELLVLAEDARVAYVPYNGPLTPGAVSVPSAQAEKPVEHMLVLGWNEKIFPIVQEFDNYVGAGSTLTLVNTLDVEEREKQLEAAIPELKNIQVRHQVGEFTSRPLMEALGPQNYPTIMVLGDSTGDASAEDSDTRAIIALLLIRDLSVRTGVGGQEICSEILDPKNRELAATTQIDDIVISNEMVSMVLAQITYEPRVRAVLEDFFTSEGSEIYLKAIDLYVPHGEPTTFEHLILAAKARGECALGVQVRNDDASRKYGLILNPVAQRRLPFAPKPGDRLVVLAEDDG